MLHCTEVKSKIVGCLDTEWLYVYWSFPLLTEGWLGAVAPTCCPVSGDRTVLLAQEKIQFSSVAQLCLTLCNPMDCSTPGFPVHHQLLELTQTQVHRVGDAIQPSHPLSSPSLPTIYLSQHQGFFKWVSSLHEVTKVLEKIKNSEFKLRFVPNAQHFCTILKLKDLSATNLNKGFSRVLGVSFNFSLGLLFFL